MLTREFACDLFVQGTNEANWSDMMQKGYCLDLSGSDVLQAAVKRMHPYIAAQARYEGRLYAIPMRINFMGPNVRLYLVTYRPDDPNLQGYVGRLQQSGVEVNFVSPQGG